MHNDGGGIGSSHPRQATAFSHNVGTVCTPGAEEVRFQVQFAAVKFRHDAREAQDSLRPKEIELI